MVDRRKISQTDLDKQARLKSAVDSLSVGKAVLVSKTGNDYLLAKLLGKEMEVADVKIDFLAVQGSKSQVDSLVGLLNSGVSLDSVASSPLVAQSQKDMEISLLDANYAPMKELIADRATGVYFTPDTLAEGGRIFRVNERKAPVAVYDLASVTFTTEPSNATVNDLDAALRKYVEENKTAKDFVEHAQEAGYTTFPATVTASSPMIGNLNDSHNAVAWVMDAKKGRYRQCSAISGPDASSPWLLTTSMTAAMFPYATSRFTQSSLHVPSTTRKQLNSSPTMKARPKDIAGYAQLMKTSVDTTTVNFGQYMIPGLGMNESVVMGKIANAQKGALVGPLQGNNAVIVMQVTEIDNAGRPFDLDENTIRYNQQRGAARMINTLDRILIGNKKVTNNINAFYK